MGRSGQGQSWILSDSNDAGARPVRDKIINVSHGHRMVSFCEDFAAVRNRGKAELRWLAASSTVLNCA